MVDALDFEEDAKRSAAKLKNGSRKLTMNEGMQFTREGPSRETQISRGIFKRYLHGTRHWMR